MAEYGGCAAGWVGAVRHLLDLHKGYHTPPRTHGLAGSAGGEHDRCARGGARSGLRQVEEMPNRLPVVEELLGDGVHPLWSGRACVRQRSLTATTPDQCGPERILADVDRLVMDGGGRSDLGLGASDRASSGQSYIIADNTMIIVRVRHAGR